MAAGAFLLVADFRSLVPFYAADRSDVCDALVCIELLVSYLLGLDEDAV
jgi:hypothetical protein